MTVELTGVSELVDTELGDCWVETELSVCCVEIEPGDCCVEVELGDCRGETVDITLAIRIGVIALVK